MPSESPFAWTRSAEFWRGAALLLVLCLAAYATVLRPSAGFVWDDVAITDNRLVLSPGGLADLWLRPLENTHEQHYWPLTYTTFWIEHKLWGLRAPGFHLVNVLLHAANCVLLWRLLRRLAVPGAWFAAALFAVHPVHAESVAWIIERKDVLSGLFYLLACFLHLDFVDTRRRDRQLAAVVLFLAGMLSKSVVVTLPVALLIVQWWRSGRFTLRDVADVAPMAFLGFVVALADTVYGATWFPNQFELPLLERLLIAPRALWFYLEKLLWPAGQMAIYPKWPTTVDSVAGWIALAALPAAVALLWLFRNRIGRGPLAVFLFYAITLAPVLGFIPFGFLRYAWVADRYQYLASIAPIALFAAAGARLSASGPVRFHAARAGAAALILVLAVLTSRHAFAYGHAETLWARNLELHPGAWEAHQQLGRLLSVRGLEPPGNPSLVEKGIAHLREAIRQNPDFYEAHFNLGTALHARDDFAAAEAEFRRALQIHPDFAPAHNGLGAVLAQTGRYAEAIPHFQEALDIDPYSAEAAANLQLAQEQMAGAR